jgi:DNA-binding CsgD family transcriptional regulator
MGTNWNSKLKKHTPLVSESIKQKAQHAKDLISKGKSVDEVADILNVSISRIYEYLKDLKDEK